MKISKHRPSKINEDQHDLLTSGWEMCILFAFKLLLFPGRLSVLFPGVVIEVTKTR